MNTLVKTIAYMGGGFLMAACGKPIDEQSTSNAFINEERSDIQAESIYCAGTATILKDISVDTYSLMEKWQSTFDDIAKNAMSKAKSFKDNGPNTIPSKLKVVEEQVSRTVKNIDVSGNVDEMKTLVMQTVAQCSQFASTSSN